MKIIGIIPARYKSSRFPGKALADIHGKPMVWWVHQAAKRVKKFDQVYVATDDERIASVCAGLSIKSVLTSQDHPTGTDRLGEVARKIKADLYINVQGDEPALEPASIEAAITPFIKGKADFSVTNLMSEIKNPSELLSVNVPKVVVNARNEAVFFSRLPIPYPKSGCDNRYFKQVCVYGFTPEALKKFCQLKKGPIERSEDIELLRFIENGMKIRMIEIKQASLAVDTPQDLEAVRKILKGRC